MTKNIIDSYLAQDLLVYGALSQKLSQTGNYLFSKVVDTYICFRKYYTAKISFYRRITVSGCKQLVEPNISAKIDVQTNYILFLDSLHLVKAIVGVEPKMIRIFIVNSNNQYIVFEHTSQK